MNKNQVPTILIKKFPEATKALLGVTNENC